MFLTKGFNILSCQFYHLFQLISKFVQISSVFLSIGLVQYYNVLFRYLLATRFWKPLATQLRAPTPSRASLRRGSATLPTAAWSESDSPEGSPVNHSGLAERCLEVKSFCLRSFESVNLELHSVIALFNFVHIGKDMILVVALPSISETVSCVGWLDPSGIE